MHMLIPRHAGISMFAPRDSVPSCALPDARGVFRCAATMAGGSPVRRAHVGINYAAGPHMTFQRLTLTSAAYTDRDNPGCLTWDVSHLD
jgi:hypothetical protein